MPRQSAGFAHPKYLNFRGGKFSKSRGAAVDVPYFLSKCDPDPLRFYLTATAPETRDTEFSWEDFVERNNNELVATWRNLANRMLSFAYKRFDGVVPEPGEFDDEDRALLEKVEAGLQTVGDLYDACHLRAALGEALAQAREASGYLDRKAPWFQIKEDKATAATTVYVVLRAVDNLKTILAPILPLAKYLAEPFEGSRLVLAPGAAGALAGKARPAGPLALLIGPEGGWSPAELALAEHAGCAPLALGPRVLRTETAGLAALAALQTLWGDFAGDADV